MENQPNRSKIAPHNSTCLHSQNLQGSLLDVTLESSGKSDVHEITTKRVGEKQSVCSQVIVRQISQLVNATASRDSLELILPN